MISGAGNRETVRTRPGRGSSTALRDALWLAGRDIRASWMSFPAAVVVASFFGLLATPQYANALNEEMGAIGDFFLDFYLICLVAVLGTNMVFNRDYSSSLSTEAFDERLSFLKGLPVSARTLVAGRVITALASLACGAPPFFLVPYLVSGRLPEAIGGVDYLWFVGAWLGYGLLGTGALVFLSFGFRWRSRQAPFLFVVPIVAFVALTGVVSLVFDGGIAMAVLGAARDHGPLPAAVGIGLGAFATVLSMKASEGRLQRRDVG